MVHAGEMAGLATDVPTSLGRDTDFEQLHGSQREMISSVPPDSHPLASFFCFFMFSVMHQYSLIA